MTSRQIIEEKPVTLTEVKDDIKKIKKRDKELNFRAVLTAVSEKHPEKVRVFSKDVGKKVPCVSLQELVRRCDFIIEAAHPEVAPVIARLALENDKYVLIMSVGGLLGFSFQKLIAKTLGRLYCPSGAIAGVDALLAGQGKGLRRVRLITTKPPQALAGAPYFKTHEFPALKNSKEKKLVFRGTALQASRAFPQNINVAAILSLAGLGPKKTEVEIWITKANGTNSHEVLIEGDFGRIRTITENHPAPQNPKTSYLAILSAVATLRKAFITLRLGT